MNHLSKIIVFSLFFLLFKISYNVPHYNAALNTNNYGLAKTTNFTAHDPISLLNDSAVQMMAQNEDWSGSGSVNNPFIIAGYSFNGGYYGIEIRNVQSYIIIELNTFQSNYSYGIYIQNSPNIVIQQNIISTASIVAIYSSGSSITIINNGIYDNGMTNVTTNGNGQTTTITGEGIKITNSNHVTIVQNKFDGNLLDNLLLTSDTNVNITGNDIKTRSKDYSDSVYIEKCTNVTFFSNTFIDPLALDDTNILRIDSSSSAWILENYFYKTNFYITGSNNLYITANVAEQSSLSIYGSININAFNNTLITSALDDNYDIIGCNFTNNYFTDNSYLSLIQTNSSIINKNYVENQQAGIMLDDAFYNKISFNYFTNVQNEVYIQPISRNGSYLNNTFFGNNFMDKDISLVLSGMNNFWDNGSYGNYWATYTGNDTNNDNIGDTKYNFSSLLDSPVSNQYDNYPLMNPSVMPNLTYFNYTLSKIESLIASSSTQHISFTYSWNSTTSPISSSSISSASITFSSLTFPIWTFTISLVMLTITLQKRRKK